MCAIEGLSRHQVKKIIVAYEPIWAIGTNKKATPKEAESVHQLIHKVIARNWDREVSESIPVIYGGSIRAENMNRYLTQSDIDGVFIGASSIEWKNFYRILRTAL